jgi:ribosomal 50S subunit-recycling heat shock protein
MKLKINKKKGALLVFSVLAVAILVPTSYYFLTRENQEKSTEEVRTEEVEVSHTGKITSVEGEVFVNGKDAKEKYEVKRGDEIEVGEGKTEVMLEDGSYVRLNRNTKVAMTELKKDRYEVELKEGVVYSRVAKGEGREYVVSAGEYKYKALGTAFSVELGEEVKLVVFESTVEARKGEEVVEVEEGKEAIGIEPRGLVVEELDREFVEYNKEMDEKEYGDNYLGILATIKFEEEQKEETQIQQPTPEPEEDFRVQYLDEPPFFPGFFEVSRDGFEAMLATKEPGEEICASDIGTITLPGGLDLFILNCDSDPNTGKLLKGIKVYFGGEELTATFAEAYDYSDYMPGEGYVVIPVAVAPGKGDYYKPWQQDTGTKYGRRPYTSENGTQLWVSDEFIDDLYEFGFLR